MQTRMDKYNTSKKSISSRIQKNQALYEEVRNSTIAGFDVNSNVSIIEENANNISVNRVRKLLDQRYNEDAPKRRSIEVPEFDDPIIEEPLQDTKEYDINAILEKAKKGKNVDYNKERLKKVRETQYEILNNLDLELKKVEDAKNINNKKEAEDNLMNLINTITELEIKNKAAYSKEASEALELLSDLKDDSPEEEPTEESIEQQEETKDENKEEKKEPDTDTKENYEEADKVEKTLSKLNIDISSYDDFSDVSKRDVGSIVLKIIIFIVIIALVIGAVFILDKILGLGLLK